jgi:hypothetical protein
MSNHQANVLSWIGTEPIKQPGWERGIHPLECFIPSSSYHSSIAKLGMPASRTRCRDDDDVGAPSLSKHSGVQNAPRSSVVETSASFMYTRVWRDFENCATRTQLHHHADCVFTHTPSRCATPTWYPPSRHRPDAPNSRRCRAHAATWRPVWGQTPLLLLDGYSKSESPHRDIHSNRRAP